MYSATDVLWPKPYDSEVVQLTLVYSGPNVIKRSCRIAGSWVGSTMFVSSIDNNYHI